MSLSSTQGRRDRTLFRNDHALRARHRDYGRRRDELDGLCSNTNSPIGRACRALYRSQRGGLLRSRGWGEGSCWRFAPIDRATTDRCDGAGRCKFRSRSGRSYLTIQRLRRSGGTLEACARQQPSWSGPCLLPWRCCSQITMKSHQRPMDRDSCGSIVGPAKLKSVQRMPRSRTVTRLAVWFDREGQCCAPAPRSTGWRCRPCEINAAAHPGRACMRKRSRQVRRQP
jgi:hypothetical protein